MGTKVIWLAAIILPFVYALASRGVAICEKKSGIRWQIAAVLTAAVGIISFLFWISVGVFWMFQAWDDTIRSILVPLYIIMLMPAIACGIVRKDDDVKPLPKTTDQRLDAVEAKLQALESAVNAMSENGKEHTDNAN